MNLRKISKIENSDLSLVKLATDVDYKNYLLLIPDDWHDMFEGTDDDKKLLATWIGEQLGFEVRFGMSKPLTSYEFVTMDFGLQKTGTIKIANWPALDET